MEQDDYDDAPTRKRYDGPYTDKHPIPNIQRYREERKEIKRDEEAQNRRAEEDVDSSSPQGQQGTRDKAKGLVKDMFGVGEPEHVPGKVYDSQNRNETDPTQLADSSEHQNQEQKEDNGQHDAPTKQQGQDPPQMDSDDEDNKEEKSAAEVASGISDPTKKRKAMKKHGRQAGGREVTDPVTHLPITIHDLTDKDLKKAPENIEAVGSTPQTSTGFSGATKTQEQLDEEAEENQRGLEGMHKLFPPPEYDAVQTAFDRVFHFAFVVGIGSISILFLFTVIALQVFRSGSEQSRQSEGWTRVLLRIIALVLPATMIGAVIIWGLQGWLSKKVQHIWEDQVWSTARDAEHDQNSSFSTTPESTQWFNMLLASIWPLINPDLFTSLSDTLEDTMQASLPKMVRMVSVEDLGQGSESIRILGVRWLPTGAAAQTVGEDGKLKSPEDQQGKSGDQKQQVQEIQSPEDEEEKDDSDESEKEDNKDLHEGETGDFVNLEIAFAYRARASSRSLKTKANNAHLLMRFYLPGNIAVPVWVELRGIVATARVRIQLGPDPPFLNLMTLTFMGQPKADMSAVPLSKHNLNVMDIPGLSNFVQSSIDAALAEYVAPKSLTLDLKQMLAGDDFKKDTAARGALLVRIRKAYGFKEGDSGIGPLKNGSSDPYCSVSWAKFGKPVMSTRIILSEMEPFWDEYTCILVGPEELNAEELLRVSLWDSDRSTADDELGRVEIPLHELMSSKKTKGQMMDRKDGLEGTKKGQSMPGTLEWSVGYFSKTRVTDKQLAEQDIEPQIRSVDELKRRVTEGTNNKLREAQAHDESRELEQQRSEDYRELEQGLITSSKPPDEYPSGVLSIQIHQITGLELEQVSKSRSKRVGEDDSDNEDEGSDDLPSSYCTIILNHAKIYKTRTKPKSAKPFFNAGTERYVKDWRSAEVIVSVRDSRVHENDPLLGVVYLPLARIFEKKSQVVLSAALAGGLGYGRARISLVWRSLEIKLPKEMIGWDYGTFEIRKTRSTNLPSEYQGLRLRVDSGMTHGKLRSSKDSDEWHPRRGRSALCLAVSKRYCTPIVFEFRKSSLGPDDTPAWAVFWLKDIPDDEEQKLRLPVWSKNVDLKRGRTCVDFDKQGEKPIGEIEVTAKFWKGLSGYHAGLASKSKQQDLKDVMEVLDTVNDTDGRSESEGDEPSKSKSDDDDSSTSSSSSSDSELSEPSDHSEDDRKESKTSLIKAKAKALVNGDKKSDDGSRGAIDAARDYKKNSKQLHRKHRGLMQWKPVRTVDWAKTKMEGAKDGIVDKFNHSEREPGIETEI